MKALKWIGGILLLVFAVVAIAAWQGRSEQRRMQNALLMTGHYVGMSEGQLFALGTKIADEGDGTIGEAREVIFWLVCSGRISHENIEQASRTALRLMTVQHLSEKEAVARLLYMIGEVDSIDPFIACPK
jgi:phage-related minor tail protein